MYKDKQKQREANRQAMRRSRAKCSRDDIPPSAREMEDIVKGITPGITSEGITEPKRGKDIKCFEDLPRDVQQAIIRLGVKEVERQRRIAIAINYQHIFPDRFEPNSDQQFTRLLAQAGPGHVRVSKPGDEVYVPMCKTTKTFCAETGGGEGGGPCGRR